MMNQLFKLLATTFNVMDKKKRNLILVLIFVISLGLRIWKSGDYPPLLWDEASLGYNAYSILKTGQDEYSKTLPLIFKSFGDYKPGLYIYLTVPFIWILGLTQLAVRLPSIILGSLTPIAFYFLIKSITNDQKLSFLSAVVLAILPWHIHFSRGAWEANVMTFFVTLGTYFFVRWVNELRVTSCVLFLFLFLLALITYQGGKLMVPLIGLGLLYIGARTMNKEHGGLKEFFAPKFIVPSLIFLILTFGWYLASFSGQASNRLKVMSLFSYHRPEEEITQILAEDELENKNIHYFLFHGEWLHFLKGSLSRYLNHFSPQFLGFEGDWQNARHSAPYIGTISQLGLFLLIIGLIFYIKNNNNWKNSFFIYWLIIAPISAALTRDSVSSVRALTMVIPLSFFIAYGLKSIFNLKINRFLLITVYLLLITFFSFNFIYYHDLYYNHMVKLNPKQWLYGYKEATEFVIDNQKAFDQVIMTDFYGQPYIYYLFYSRYSPQKYHQQAELITNNQQDVGTVSKIDEVSFRGINWKVDIKKDNTLIILSQDEVFRNELGKTEIMDSLKPLGKINKQSMFYGYSTKN